MLFLILTITVVLIDLGVANKVIEINVNTFQQVVLDSNHDFWIIDFYAPWCGHCKKMSPVLDEVATIAGDKMKIGKVNAVASKELAKTYKVDAYPTILYFKNGEQGVYTGPHTVQGMTAFMHKMLDPRFLQRVTAGELDAMLRRGGSQAVFVLYEGADIDARRDLADAFKRAANTLRTEADFVITTAGHADDTSKIQRLQYSRAPRTLQSSGSGSDAAITYEDVTNFVHHNKWTLVATLDAHSFDTLVARGKVMVIAMVDHKLEQTPDLMRAFKEAVRVLSWPDHSADGLLYCVMDASKYPLFAGELEASPNSILVWDPVKDLHYVTRDPEDLSLSGLQQLIGDFLQLPGHTERPMRQSVPYDSSTWGKVKRRFRQYQPWTTFAVLMPLVLFGISCVAPSAQDYDKND